MADREIIISSLKKVERRIRANRLFQELTFGLTLFLAFPVVLKIWDLFSPFRATSLLIIVAVWLISLTGYIGWRIGKKGTLDEAAASIDEKAGLHNEITTAFWFINHPRPSEWVDVQIQRAARTANRLDLDRLYPWNLPRTSYMAGAMILAFVGLNLLPLPWNHNWLVMQAAPAFSLTDQQQTILKQAQELLQKAAGLKQPELVKELEEIIKQLEQGKINADQAAARLDEIRKKLEAGQIDASSLDEGLKQMARDLEKSELLRDAAEALKNQQLDKAAEALYKLVEDLENQNAKDLKELQQSLEQASENTTQGLEDLSNDMKDAADKLKAEDSGGVRQALAAAAKDLEDLQKKKDTNQLKKLTSDQLQKLAKSLREHPEAQSKEAIQDSGEPGLDAGEQDQDAEKDDQQGPRTAKGGQRGGQPGPGDGTPSEEASGDEPGDAPQGDVPREGAPTKLEVQLVKEGLVAVKDETVKPEEIEEASKQERSRLDYRNVKSDLTPAQKDLLNKDRIPWEYRPLIKEYFQAIRPPEKK